MSPRFRIFSEVELSQISALLEPFLDSLLPAPELAQISTYIDLLLRWNARINLSAVRDPDSIVSRHFGESFFLARHVLPAPEELSPDSPERPEDSKLSAALGSGDAPAAERRKNAAHGVSRGSATEIEEQAPLGAKENTPCVLRVLDIGSGAGFPGLPLKIWAPNISLTLIESNHKKAAFLREVSRALTLTGVNVITERAENLIGRIEPAGLVTFRAVEHFEAIVPLAARFLAPSGRLAILVGAAKLSTLTRLVPQLSWLPPIPVPLSESRILAIAQPGT